MHGTIKNNEICMSMNDKTHVTTANTLAKISIFFIIFIFLLLDILFLYVPQLYDKQINREYYKAIVTQIRKKQI